MLKHSLGCGQRTVIKLVLVVLMAAQILWPAATIAATNPQSGNLDISGQVRSAAPTAAAVITQPTHGQHFDHSAISVLGTCSAGFFVEIYKNGIFAGVTQCQTNGTFLLKISLVPGKNTLVARTRSITDQYGPDSATVDVFYDATAAAASFPALVVTTDRFYIGTFTNKPLDLKLGVVGGKAPYALNIDWDDGSNSLIPREMAGSFGVQNTFGTPGHKFIKITATDSSGQTASVQTLAIINGEVQQVTAGSLLQNTYNRLFESLLTVLGLLLIIFLSFYLGYEWRVRHEKRLAARHTAHHPHVVVKRL